MDIVAEVCGCRFVDEMVRTYSDRGLPPSLLKGDNDELKNCKVWLIHLGHSRKVSQQREKISAGGDRRCYGGAVLHIDCCK